MYLHPAHKNFDAFVNHSCTFFVYTYKSLTMKKIYTLSSLLVLIASSALFLGSSGGRVGTYSGSPGDNGINCSNCHSGSPSTVTGIITSNIPSSGYDPGVTYTITISISHPSNNTFGFQLTAEDSTNAKIGGFTAPNNSVQVVNGGNAVTHTASGNSGTSNARSWTIDWQAPAAGTGEVTFYVACLASSGSNTNNQVSLSSKTVTEDVPTTPIDLNVVVSDESCPGDCDGEINATASGGAGGPFAFTISGGQNTNLCPGQYTVTAIDSENNSTQQTVTVGVGEPVDTPSIILDFDRVIANSANANSYRWFVNGNLIPGADSSWVFVSQNGFYQAVALSSTGCEAPSDSLAFNSFSVEGHDLKEDNIYPNPGYQQINWTIGVNHVRLYNLQGQIVAEKIGQNIQQLDIPERIASGRYILERVSNDKQSIKSAWQKL